MAQKLTLGKRLVKAFTIPQSTFCSFWIDDEEVKVEFKVPTAYNSYQQLYADAIKAVEAYPDDEKELMGNVWLLSFVIQDVSFDELEELARTGASAFQKLLQHFNDVYNNPGKYCTKDAVEEAEKNSEKTVTGE